MNALDDGSIHIVPFGEGILPSDGIYVQNESPLGEVGIYRVVFSYKVLRDQSPEVVMLDEERDIVLRRGERVRLDSAVRLRDLLLQSDADKALGNLTSDDYEAIYVVYYQPEATPRAGTPDMWLRMTLGIGDLFSPDAVINPVVRVPKSEPGTI